MPARTLCIIFLLVRLSINAQAPAWQWAKYAASSGAEVARDVSYDASSNSVYIGGTFNGNLSSTYGSSFSSSYGAKDGFLAKYDASGNFLWAIKVGGSGDDEIRGVANDPSGNVYVSGYFKNTADFDPSAATFSLASAGGQDGFLAKYSPSGTFIWAVKFGSTADEDCYKLFVDANGAYITGSYKSPSTFYSTNSVTKNTTALFNGPEFFGARYDLSGVVQWVVSGAGDKEDEGYDVVADNNKVYFTGYYKNTFYVNDVTTNSVVAIQEPGGDKPNAFILAFSISGNYAWSSNVASGDVDYGYGIGQDAGNIYVTGSIRATANFKYPSPQFTQTVSGATDIFLAKLDKSTGNFLWACTQTGSGTGDEEPFAVETDIYGNVIITGYFKNNLNYSSYGGPSVNTSGGEDIFVTTYNSSGNFLWMKQGIGTNPDFGRALSTSTTGAIYVAGEYAAGLTLDTYTLVNAGGSNIFVAKTGCEIISNNTVSSSQTICAGSSPSLLNGSVPTGGNNYSWQMSTNSTTWTTAAGTFTNQNYSAPGLTTTTYFRRDVSPGGACLNISSSPVLTITVDQPPSPSNAGPTQTICTAGATLNATIPLVGSGTWSVIAGAGLVASLNNPASPVTSLSTGTNSFAWIVSNGVCPSSTSTVWIMRDIQPASNAGTNQIICSSSTTLTAVTPTTGNGSWSLLSGSGNISSPANPASQVTALGTGTNTFAWTVINGVCPAATSTVNITRDIQPTSNAGFNQTICSSTVNLSATSPTTGAGTWSVLSGNGTVVSVNSPSSQVTGLSTGTNSFVWSVINGVCPAATSTVTITRDAPPTPAFAGNSQTVCSTSISLNANTPLVGNGMWSVITGPSSVSSPTNPLSSLNNLSVGSNQLVWTITNGVCPASTSTVSIARDNFPTTSSAGVNQTVCSLSSVLNANTPLVGSGTWSVISGAATISSVNNPSSPVNNLSVGQNQFVWTITNGSCPASSSTITINMDNFPTLASASNIQPVCTNSVTLNANAPQVGTGAWSVITGSATVSSVNNATSVANNLSVGANQLAWTISNGVCPPSSDTITVIRDDYPTIATAGNSQTICSLFSNLNGNTPLIGTGVWSVVSGSAIINSASNPNSGVNNLSVGPNQFVWTITNGSCPVSSASVTIYRDDFPTTAIAGNSQSVCSTSAILGANSPVVGTGMWSVLSGPALITSVQSATTNVAALGTGSNKFRWTILNGVCPASSDSVIVQRDAQPDVAICAPDQHICGNTFTVSANTPTTGAGSWYVLSGSGTFNNQFSPNTTISGLSNGVIKVSWVVSNGVCPPNSDTLAITADAMPSAANAGEDKTVCASSVNVSAITPTAGTGYWTILSGSCLLGSPNIANSTVDSLMPGATILRWIVSNGICPASTDDIIITRDLPPSPAIAGEDKETDIPVIAIQAQNPVTGSGSWSVIEGNGTIDNPQNSSIKISNLSAGANTFRWTVRNGVCPENTDDVTVTLNPLQIPNAFTPNGDGANDHFVIPGLDYYPNTAVHIFNRWGAEVYSSNDYKNNWNGSNTNNEKLADDTYYYIIELDSKKSYTGFLIIKQK